MHNFTIKRRNNLQNCNRLRQRAIFAPTNANVNEINFLIQQRLPGNLVSYKAIDEFESWLIDQSFWKSQFTKTLQWNKRFGGNFDANFDRSSNSHRWSKRKSFTDIVHNKHARILIAESSHLNSRFRLAANTFVDMYTYFSELKANYLISKFKKRG